MPNWNSAVAALEQDGAGTRFMLVARDGRVIAATYAAHRRLEPEPGRIEYEPRELWYQVRKVVASGLDVHRTLPGEIAAVGLTSDPLIVLVWNRDTGECYGNAIGSGDRRAVSQVRHLEERGEGERIRDRTRRILTARMPAPRLAWLLENVPGLRQDAEQGRALYGSPATWLRWNLTGEHTVDPTLASATLLWNADTGEWDSELLNLFGVPRMMLPEVIPARGSRPFPETKETGPFAGRVRVAATIAAEQADLVGSCCFEKGQASWRMGEDFRVLIVGRRTLSMPAEVEEIPVWRPGEHLHESALLLSCAAQDRWFARMRELPLLSVTVSGPRAQDDDSNQDLADKLGMPVLSPAVEETTALGAAFAAGLAASVWESEASVRSIWQCRRVYRPR